ncbi:unnamed protein product, partial [Scytosiphon promiscuus]
MQVSFSGCSSGHPDCIKKSIRANVKTLRRLCKDSPRNLWKVGTDEVATNQKPDWDSTDNTFVGFCMEHSTCLRQQLVFDGLGRLENVKDLFDSDRLHLGKEALVVTMAQVGSSKGHAVPVFAGASCKA